MPMSHSHLLEAVEDAQSVSDLRHYFGVGLPEGASPPFTGAWFEFVGGGGDTPRTANAITADDLIAVHFLSVVVPRAVAADLLLGPLGSDVSVHLADTPTDVELGSDAARRLLQDGGPADRAWKLLEDPDEMGWVTAGKLLARKRPRLVPVYDRVVRCALGRPAKPWLQLNDMFAVEAGALPELLTHVRSEAGVDQRVSPARVLDVILWMRHHRSHRPSRCPRLEFGSRLSAGGT